MFINYPNVLIAMSIWDKADIIKVSDVELEFLTGNKTIDDETAMSLWHPNLKLLLVTLGENGCRYYTKVMYNKHSCGFIIIMMILVCDFD